MVGAGNKPVSLHLYPAGSRDQAMTLAHDPGNSFWLVIDVQTSKNPNSLFAVSLKGTRNGTAVDLPVQTFNLFNAGMHRPEGEYFTTAWQADISELVHGGSVDLSKALEVTVRPFSGDASGIVRVTGMRVEAE